jgi:predicted PurR-regulated permease PerM
MPIMNKLKFSSIFFILIFAALIFLVWLLFRPFMQAIIFGAIVAGATYPLFHFLQRKLKYNREKTAILMCIIISVVILLPTIFISIQVSKETVNLYKNIKEEIGDQSVNNFLFGSGAVATTIRKTSKYLNLELDMDTLKERLFYFVKSISGKTFFYINKVIGNILSFVFQLFIMLMLCYALFAHGHQLRDYLINLSPIPKDQLELMVSKFNEMNYVTLVCNGLGGVIQGGLAGIAFWIAGIHSVFLWSTVMVILAFIPLVGISIIYIPTCIILLIKGHTLAAILLFVFCSIVAFFTENWFKPKFIGDKIRINSVFVLFCIIGGINVFGIAGVFYGPIIGILFLTVVDIYHKSYKYLKD